MGLNTKITLIRDWALDSCLGPRVATIGNYDGLHQGHRQVIEKVVALAKAHNLPATVITFEPNPSSYFNPEEPSLRLCSLTQKLAILASWGIQQVICLRFNAQLARLTAKDFVQTLLCDAWSVKHLIVGEDFRFGYQQQGDVDFLTSQADVSGFCVHSVALKRQEHNRISSTEIRSLLIKGQMAQVVSLLGRPYQITKRVIHGEKRGRRLGFPTANIPVHAKATLFKGVFITRVWVDNEPYWSVTNVGRRPSVDGRHYLIESHLLNFHHNLYGKRITVEFWHKIRDEQRFETIAELSAKIQSDVDYANRWLVKNYYTNKVSSFSMS